MEVFTPLALLSYVGATAAGAATAAAVCQWRAHRALTALQARLAVCELARQAAVDRSQQARAQIGQLSKALTDLTDARRTRPSPTQPQQATPDFERTVTNPLLQPRVEAMKPFADTQVFSRRP